MKNVLKSGWQSLVRYVEVFESGSSYPFEQIHELQLEVAKLKADGLVCAACAKDREG